MKAGELREQLRQVGDERGALERHGLELETKTVDLLRRAQDHPEVSLVEAAQLLGFKRRASAYDLLERRSQHG